MSVFRHSLSRKLSLSIMLMAIPVFMLSLGIFYTQSRYLIRQEAIERSNSILRTTIQRVCNYMTTIAASTHDSRWLIVGTCCYVISWIMLGFAILFLGSDTVKFLRGSGKRKFRAWRRARRLWKHIQHEAKH